MTSATHPRDGRADLVARSGKRFYLPDGSEQRERDAAYTTLHETQPWGPRQAIWEYDVRDDLKAPL